ncbi:site-specific integrase [Vibrio parahaemolyticus]|nr:site-specific integrase [Vibrio parahaemolyticus]
MLLLDSGASLKVIKDALGHSSIAVTDHYLRTFHDEAKEYTTGISLTPKAL